MRSQNQLKLFQTLTKNIKHCLLNEDSEPDVDFLTEKLKHYVEMLAQADRTNNEDIYDFFCQSNGMEMLRKLLKHDILVVVKTISLLLINLKNELWINFILLQPLLTQLITLDLEEDDDELTEHYISLLKSLSIRLDANSINLFYNKKFCRFPLIYQALKYYNHMDNMVRTSVMNLTLGVMKIKNERVTRYFETFPFTTYIIHFCCTQNDHWKLLDSLVTNLQSGTKQRLKMQLSDEQDNLYYLYDVFQYGGPTLKANVKSCVLSYSVLPVLIGSLLPNRQQTILIGDDNCSISPKLSLYLLLLFLRIFKDKETTNLIASILFGRRIHRKLLQKITQQIVVPKSYQREFTPDFYWDKFQFEMDEHCQSLFSDISKFQTEHEEKKKQGQKLSEEYEHQISRLSQFLGFNLLDRTNKEPRWTPYINQKNSEQMEINPIRANLMEMLKQKDDSQLWLLTNLIIHVQKNQEIDNDLLKFAGLLMPKLDTVNYQDEYNVESITYIRNAAIEQIPCVSRMATLRNLCILVDELTFNQLNQMQLKSLLTSYDNSIHYLRSQIKIEFMGTLVRHFEEIHRRWMTHVFTHDPIIPYAVFTDSKTEQNVAKYSFRDPLVDQHMLQNIPSNGRELILRAILQFTMLRSVCLRYLEGCHELPAETFKNSFEEPYAYKFNQTSGRWKLGKVYQFENRQMIECKLQPADRKIKAVTDLLIVEDPHNLVMVDPSKENSNGTVFLNAKLKWIEVEMIKEDSRLVHIRWSTELLHGQHLLLFQSDIAAMAAYERLRLNAKNSFEEEQLFIVRYLQGCHKEIKNLLDTEIKIV